MKILLVLILSLKMVIVFGQLPPLASDITKSKDELPDSIKTVRQYTDNQLINVREYDLNKNLIFSYYNLFIPENWNSIEINGYVYDNNGKLKKSYQLHSNIGLSILYYEYDSLENNLKTVKRDNKYEFDEKQSNRNQFYKYLVEMTTMSELLNHSKIKEIEYIADEYLYNEKSFDIFGNVQTEITYRDNGDTLTSKSFSYDEENNIVHLNSYLWQNNHFEIIYEYDRNNRNKPKPSKLTQEVRLYFYNYWLELEPVKRISEIIFYNYNNSDQLSEKVIFRYGRLNSRNTYEYNNFGQVTTHRFFNDGDKLSVETEYSYNEDRYISKEIKQDFRTGERTVKEYYYEFEYHR